MEFELEDFHRDIPIEDLIADLKRAHQHLIAQGQRMTYRAYIAIGKFSASTITERFGSWNKALAAAGLDSNQVKNVSTDVLFENLRNVWVAKGKQPVIRDMSAPPSRFRGELYATRFGSWRDALNEFVNFVNSDDWLREDSTDVESSAGTKILGSTKRITGRSISLRMRFRILLRDSFKCQACGASPATDVGTELQVDHILPWSRGGETIEGNLQTKCKKCNLGKGNQFDQ
jgi:hypothetical protein